MTSVSMKKHSNTTRAAQPTEHAEQVAVCEYLDRVYPQVLYWATPNGASLTGRGRAMNKLKGEGFLPGVSDLIIFEPMSGYSCMFLEMKRAGGGNGASDNQMWFLREVEKRGAFGIVCNGFEEARAVLDDYFAGKLHNKPFAEYSHRPTPLALDAATARANFPTLDKALRSNWVALATPRK